MIVRQETPKDIAAIRTITEDAFRGRPYSGGDEQDVIDRLRAANALVLSLVAEHDREVVGQISFSPVTLAGAKCRWFALGPVAVKPSLQGQGIGTALINEGLCQIEATGAAGCILTGDPRYYSRFGFSLAPQHAAAEEPAEYFQLKPFTDAAIEGQFAFHPAFYSD